MSTLFDIWNTIQKKLFPWLEQELDPLSDKEREFVQVVAVLDLATHMKEFVWRGFGRKKKSRINMAKAFIAKVPHQKLIYDALNIASVPARMVKMIL